MTPAKDSTNNGAPVWTASLIKDFIVGCHVLGATRVQVSDVVVEFPSRPPSPPKAQPSPPERDPFGDDNSKTTEEMAQLERDKILFASSV